MGCYSAALMLAVVLAAVAAPLAARAELPPGCVEEATMPEEQFAKLHDTLQNTSCTFPGFLRLYDLERYLDDKDRMKGFGFSPEQTVALGSLFNDGGTLEQLILDGALTALGPHTLGLAAEDGELLLDLTSSQNTRLDVLKAIVNVTLDLDENNQTYVDAFDGFLYKEEAKNIIRTATAYGCAFGNTSVVRRLAFVIDTSGSMSTTFPGPGGKAVARMDFVKAQLDSQLSAHLDADQEFNIIQFASSASAWSPGVKPVTPENIASATAFVDKLSPGGSTAMLAGLQYAFKDPSVEGIYLLTDGAPDGSSKAIVAAVDAWSGGKKPVFPTAFMAGTQGDWMQELADITGGTFRKINS